MKRAGVNGAVIVLLAALLAGLWLSRPHDERSSQAVGVLHVAPDCDTAQRACLARNTTQALELRLGPLVRPMQPFEIALRSDLDADAQVEVQFRMRDMDMGLNRYRLQLDANGVWRGQAILPVCSAGRNDWIAQVDIAVAGQRWRADFLFRTSP